MRQWRQLIMVVIGSMIVGIGIQFIVASGLGTDSLSTLIMGLLEHSTLSFGRWSQLLNMVFLAITLLYNRQLVGIGSLINGVLVGETIAWLSQYIAYEDGRLMIIRILMLCGGFILMAFGTALYLRMNMGAGPLEGIMLILSEKLKWSIKYSRILMDASFVFLGYLLGAELGIGLVIAVFLLGPMIETIGRLLNRVDKVKVR